MRLLSEARRSIRRLAIEDRPGAIVLAEHAIDLHADLFGDLDEKLIALDALARDLIRMSRLHPEIVGLLRRVDDYIQILQHDIEAARRPRTVGAAVLESGIPAAQASDHTRA